MSRVDEVLNDDMVFYRHMVVAEILSNELFQFTGGEDTAIAGVPATNLPTQALSAPHVVNEQPAQSTAPEAPSANEWPAPAPQVPPVNVFDQMMRSSNRGKNPPARKTKK